MAFHTNTKGILCAGCQTLFNKYPGFYVPLRLWFEKTQLEVPEAHISCAGRGHKDQDISFNGGHSRAIWGKSAHNWNCAIDIFNNTDSKNLYPRLWYSEIIVEKLPGYIEWYGAPGSPYFELPHFQMRDWRKLADAGLLKLVEPE